MWLILVGWWLTTAHFVSGLLLCLTVIGIPMGIASFRMAGLALWPMGRRIVDLTSVGALSEGSHTVGGTAFRRVIFPAERSDRPRRSV